MPVGAKTTANPAKRTARSRGEQRRTSDFIRASGVQAQCLANQHGCPPGSPTIVSPWRAGLAPRAILAAISCRPAGPRLGARPPEDRHLPRQLVDHGLVDLLAP